MNFDANPFTQIHAVVPQFDYGYMGDGGPLPIACFLVDRHLFWSHPRDDGARLQEDGHALLVAATAKWARDLGF